LEADPRLAAYRVLSDVGAGAFANRAANRQLASLSRADRALAQELAYGTIRLRARLDAELGILVDRALDRLDSRVLDWLRLGLYQLRETRIPDHAAVDETVRAVKRRVGPGAAGLANAVLRRAARDGRSAEAFPDPDADPAGHLATWGSHPLWLVRRWLARWPLASVRRLVENDNLAPSVTVRWLGSDVSSGDLRSPVRGVRLTRLEGWRGMYRVEAGEPEEVIRGLPVVIQDPAASAVVDYVGGDGEGATVDLCAAPGGKTLGLATLARRARPFVATDVNGERLARLRAPLRRLQLPVHLVRMDGRTPALRAANAVLLDVPCTGTGVLRRRPDARWRVTPERLASLVRLQRDLLDSAAELVAAGGVLVYATCSLEPEENEEQVERFLARHSGFRREQPEPAAVGADLVDDDGDLRVRPWLSNTDGAYASRLRRCADADEGESRG
jgi:16S rRNA (cytosine967-C5)-methyltransferase